MAKYVTPNELVGLTGMNPKRIRKKLAEIVPSHQNGAWTYYDSEVALEAIFRAENSDSKDYSQEQARLLKAKRENVILETKILAKKLVYQSDVDENWRLKRKTIEKRIKQLEERLSEVFPDEAFRTRIQALLTEALSELQCP